MSAGHATASNADSKTPIAGVLKNDGVLRSDADVDPQLLLHIPFGETVNIQSFSVKATNAGDSKDNASGPLRLKIFANRPKLAKRLPR